MSSICLKQKEKHQSSSRIEMRTAVPVSDRRVSFGIFCMHARQNMKEMIKKVSK